MSEPSAKVIADSISSEGRRLTTFEVTMHRFVLAEFNTHRVLSRNSASSRAIPFEKQLARFRDDPMFPLEWPREQPGMQGGEALDGEELEVAQSLLRGIHDDTARWMASYLERFPEKGDRLHKSLLNRPLEWAQQHTIVVTATAWENFFRQRVGPLAQPEIRVAAELMLDAYKNSEPRLLRSGDYHLPYVWDDLGVVDWTEANAEEIGRSPVRLQVEISSARCARVSYLTQDGRRDPTEDLRLYHGNADRHGLVTAEPMHASPLEHVATPASWNERRVFLRRDSLGWIREVEEEGPDTTTLVLPKVGNFLGWQQHRLEVEMAKPYQFYG